MEGIEAQTVASRSRLSWYQCSLRTLLLMMLLLAGLCFSWPALRMQRAWQQKKHVQAIRRIQGCEVAYDGEDVFAPQISTQLPPLPAVSWTEGLFGKDFVHRAGTVGVPENRVDEVIPHLQRLPYLRRIVVLQSDSGSHGQAQGAADKIRASVPNVEAVLLHISFEIEDTMGAAP